MAIEVRAGLSVYTFADGKKTEVRADGHLTVIGGQSKTLAVFAPGKWDNCAESDSYKMTKTRGAVATA
ncbi:hypothetical protein [Amycolatopsis sp. NBC_00438]|uniref:hypothetical protein n=1 Tax=Amycolatopsis sp. NBC_00438 TaxID=2903558 RepID=UPI002E2254F2